MMISLAAIMGILVQSPLPAEPFALTGLTVVESGGLRSVGDHHRVNYRRIRVAAEDGGIADLYISTFIRDAQEVHGPRKGDVCDFSGAFRPWDARSDDRFPVWAMYEGAPAIGQSVAMVDEYACAPGRQSEPVPNTLANQMPDLPQHQTSTITIVGIGPKPDWASGIAWTSILILGQSADGDIAPYYLTFHGEDEPVPPLGGRCTIRHSPYRLEIVGGVQTRPGLKGELFDDFDCTPPPEPDFELFREDSPQ